MFLRRGKNTNEKRRQELRTELENAVDALRANELAFQQSEDALYTEQLIYQHDALMCRYRSILRELRGR